MLTQTETWDEETWDAGMLGCWRWAAQSLLLQVGRWRPREGRQPREKAQQSLFRGQAKLQACSIPSVLRQTPTGPSRVWSGSGPLSQQRGTFRERADASFWRAS